MHKKYMATVAVVIIGAIGGCSSNDKTTATPTTSSSSTSAASPQATASKAPRIMLSLPASLNGRAVNSNEGGYSFELENALTEGVKGGGSPVTSAWGTTADKNRVIAGVIEAKNPTANDAISAVIALEETGEIKPVDVTIPKDATGSSGCGVVAIKGAKHAMCVWVDERSVGIVIWFGKKPAEVKAEFAGIRKQFFIVL